MKQTFSEVDLPPTFALATPGGQALAGTSPSLELRRVDGQVFAIRLRLTLTWADWQAVEAGGWLGLPDAEPGPTFGGALRPDTEVVIEACPTPEARMLLALAGDTDAEVSAWLAETPLGAELRRTRDWRLAVAKQQVGGVMAGFRTRHGR